MRLTPSQPGWSQWRELALISGVLGFCTLLSLLAPEICAAGEPLIAIPFMVFLIILA